MSDAQIKKWIRNQRIDLLGSASTTKTLGQNKFICFDSLVPKGSAVLVKGLMPYAMRRTNSGVAADESFEMIPAIEASGYFSFEPIVTSGAPLDIETSLTAPQLCKPGGVPTATNNNDKQMSKGLVDISDDPWQDAALHWENPFFSFVVPGEARLQILFQLLSNIETAKANPMQNTFSIGADAGSAIGLKRVDFVGALVVGDIMPETLLKQLQREAEQERREQIKRLL